MSVTLCSCNRLPHLASCPLRDVSPPRYEVRDWPQDMEFPFRVADRRKVTFVAIARTRAAADEKAAELNAKVRK